ncbi:hypothetical protein LKL35_35970 [Streptomyces sp. ET3-23]|uniref:hypothetical protein n=1 Tax=Streptomyces sp. ET3-23 TaxID=2885643 RepID=UPI001D106570|nr:hypothetical protein [Streptomyces sp. ET3-23]MCC2280737.1 hypothetical protein [Streptomyces sp. ET3-23]
MTQDMWDAEDCGLLDSAARDVLAGIGTVTNRGPAADGSTVYIVGEPSYRPYRSSSIPCAEDGYRMARKVLQVIFSPELCHSVAASPLAETARRTAAAHASSLWRGDATPAARGLAALAAVAPRKGGEISELWGAYRRRNPDAAEPIMAMRDFWGSIYVFQFIRGTDARLHDLAGAVHCLSTAVDYPGATDDSGGGDHSAYARAAAEGLALLAGPAATRAVREIAVVGAMMNVKNAVARAATSQPAPDSSVVTPAEFMLARWWDAEMAPYYRTMLGTRPYRHLSDGQGTLVPAAQCHAIKRAVDSLLRYNEVVDAVPDATNHECFNEFLLALATAGNTAVLGYGTALAEVTDAVLACPCRSDGHEEAAELAMGGCLWYLLAPRYAARRQLAAYSALTPAAAPGNYERLSACTLSPGVNLHSPAWEPLWRPTPARPADQRGQLIARRSLAAGTPNQECAVLATEVLTRCDTATAETLDDLYRLTEDWQKVFDAALSATGTVETAQSGPLREVLGRIWRQTVLGDSTGTALDAQLFMDFDEAFRDSFCLPAQDGLHLRRAFLGTATGCVELTGHNPYARLANSISIMCH